MAAPALAPPRPDPAQMRLIFWDIEVYSERGFPDAARPSDHVFMISVKATYERNVRLYTTCPIQALERLEVPGDGQAELAAKFVDLYHYGSEAQMLADFYDWLGAQADADFLVGYNSDSFDTPYVVARLAARQPLISPRISYPSPCGPRFSPTFAAGPRPLDLIHFFRRYGAALPNYKLDTVARRYLGRGKLDCSIDDMRRAVRTGDVPTLSRVAAYSVMDTLLLVDLWDRAAVGATLLDLAGRIRAPQALLSAKVGDLLRRPVPELVRAMTGGPQPVPAGGGMGGPQPVPAGGLYLASPSSGAAAGPSPRPSPSPSPKRRSPAKPSRSAVPGIYRDVGVYDCSRFYAEALERRCPELAGLPVAFQLEAWDLLAGGEQVGGSPCRSPLSPQPPLPPDLLARAFMVADAAAMVAGPAPPLTPPLPEVERFEVVACVAAGRYVALTAGGEARFVGAGLICRPRFPLARELIRQRLAGTYRGVPDLSSVPPESLLVGAKRRQASAQAVKVVVTARGEREPEDLTAADRPSREFYEREIERCMEALDRLVERS